MQVPDWLHNQVRGHGHYGGDHWISSTVLGRICLSGSGAGLGYWYGDSTVYGNGFGYLHSVGNLHYYVKITQLELLLMLVGDAGT